MLAYCFSNAVSGSVSVFEDKSKVDAKLSAVTAPLAKFIDFEDKSKVDAKSSPTTVPLFILALVTASAPNFVLVAAQLLMFTSSTEASLIDLVVVLVIATV